MLELDEHLAQEYKVFQHAPSVSARKATCVGLADAVSVGCEVDTGEKAACGLLSVARERERFDGIEPAVDKIAW